MPKLVAELPRGKSFERTQEGGLVADSAVRQWRILLNQPYEAFDITDAPPNGVGVKIGDILDSLNPIPCVSLSVAADGDNKMTRLVTARYQTFQGSDAGDDPGTNPPDERLSIVSVSTSMVEVPSWTWYKVSSAGSLQGGRVAALNPAGDMYDGVLRAEPVSVITVEQFDYPTDPTQYIQHIGKVNNNIATWRGLQIQKRTMIFRGLTFRPQTVFWGTTLYRGWQSSYEFALRRNQQALGGGNDVVETECGWDLAWPQTGFNVIEGGERKRALVQLEGSTEKVPSAQPVALNDDGTFRDARANGALVYRRGIYDEVDFSTAFAHLRLAAGS